MMRIHCNHYYVANQRMAYAFCAYHLRSSLFPFAKIRFQRCIPYASTQTRREKALWLHSDTHTAIAAVITTTTTFTSAIQEHSLCADMKKTFFIYVWRIHFNFFLSQLATAAAAAAICYGVGKIIR